MWGKDHRPNSALAQTMRLYGEYWKLQPFVPGLNLTSQPWCFQLTGAGLHTLSEACWMKFEYKTIDIQCMTYLVVISTCQYSFKKIKDISLNGGIIIGPKSSFVCKWHKSHVPIEVKCMAKSWGRRISWKLRLLFMHIATVVYEIQGPFGPAASKYNKVEWI